MSANRPYRYSIEPLDLKDSPPKHPGAKKDENGVTRCPVCGAASKDPTVLDTISCKSPPTHPKRHSVMDTLGLKPERKWRGEIAPMKASIGDIWEHPRCGPLIGCHLKGKVDMWCYPNSETGAFPAVLEGYNPLVRKVVVSDRTADLPYQNKDQERLFIGVLLDNQRDTANQYLKDQGFVLVDGYTMSIDRDKEPGFLHITVEGIGRPWKEST
jgi:hypothetical protein